jgi:hypothetical protein
MLANVIGQNYIAGLRMLSRSARQFSHMPQTLRTRTPEIRFPSSLWSADRVSGKILPGLKYVRSIYLPGKALPVLAIVAPCSRSLSRIQHSRKAMSTAQGSPPQSIVHALPISVQPYALLARLDKPIGTWLLLWPCMWSIAIVAPVGALPNIWMMTKFSIGAFVMRGAGCTINDLWDMDIDSKVQTPC